MVVGEKMDIISLITIVSFLIDRITKILVINNINLYESINVVDNFFSLTYVKNYGAAWSILSGNRLFLIIVGVVALILIYKCFIKDRKINKLETITYGLLLGGIIGNLVDRIIYGYVIDFFDFIILGYDFPVFNCADTFIVISVFLIIISMFRGEINENNS